MSQAAAQTDRIGEVLDGKYRITRIIGQGGMGAVYAGEHVRVKRPVAIKILHAGAATSAEMAERFEREAQAAGRIGSDHIVEVYDLGSTPAGERFMVMEYLEGESLRSRIKRHGHLTPAEIVSLFSQMFEGLQGAHAAGIVHRDLKPDNVFVVKEKAGRRDFVKILDFGISKFTQMGADEGSMTRDGVVLGSPNYMSPEHVKTSNEVDARSDLYSAGVMMWEALCGHVPRKAGTFAELLFKVVYEPVPDPRTVVPDLDPRLAAIVNRACQADRAARFQSADEMRHALLSLGNVQGGAGAGQLVDESTGGATVALEAMGMGPGFSSGVVGRAGSTSQPSYNQSHPGFPGAGFPGGHPSASQPSFGGPGSQSFPRGQAPPPAFGSGSQPSYGPTSQPSFGSGSQPSYGSQPSAFGAPSSGLPAPASHTVHEAPKRRGGAALLVVGAAVVGIGGTIGVATWLGGTADKPVPAASVVVPASAPPVNTAPAVPTPTADASASAEPPSTDPSAEPSAAAAVEPGPTAKPVAGRPRTTGPATAKPTAAPDKPPVKPTKPTEPDLGY